MLQPNQKEKSLVNRRLIYDYLKVRNLTPEKLEINDDLRKAMGQARVKQKKKDEKRTKERDREARIEKV